MLIFVQGGKSMNDRRIGKTKHSLQNALIILTKSTPFECISVSDLCKKADISRSTFYIYYSNISDVWNAIQDDFIRDLQFDTTHYTFFQSDSERMIQYVMDNRDVFLFLMDHGTLRQYLIHHIGHLVAKYALENKRQMNQLACELFSGFIVNGCIPILTYYLTKDTDISAKKLTGIIYELIIGSFPVIKNIVLTTKI
jgi:AcrR family transcriptional regulator